MNTLRRSKLVWCCVGLVVVGAVTTNLVAQQAPGSNDDFSRRVEVLEKTVLELTQRVTAIEKVVVTPAHVPSSRLGTGIDVIESTIDGEFEGWDGDTIFKLDNGQIWQQAEYDYTYEYAYRPDVIIYRTSEGWKMKVEDVSDTIVVKRIK